MTALGAVVIMVAPGLLAAALFAYRTSRTRRLVAPRRRPWKGGSNV